MGENGLLKQIQKRLLERALNAELKHRSGYPKRAVEGRNSGNSRNGMTRKTLQPEQGPLEFEVPRGPHRDV